MGTVKLGGLDDGCSAICEAFCLQGSGAAGRVKRGRVDVPVGITIHLVGDHRAPARAVHNLCDPVLRIGDGEGIAVRVLLADKIPCRIENLLIAVLVTDHVTVCGAAVDGECQVAGHLVRPALVGGIAGVIEEVMDRPVSFSMPVVICPRDGMLFNLLVVIQAEPLAIADVRVLVIAVPREHQIHGHAAPVGIQYRVAEHQVAVIVVDMHFPRPAGVLGMVVPEVLQAGIIDVGDGDMGADVLPVIHVVGCHVGRIQVACSVPRLRQVLYQQAVVIAVPVPFLHHGCDVQGNVARPVRKAVEGTDVLWLILKDRRIVPGDGGRFPFLPHLVNGDGAVDRPGKKGRHHQQGLGDHVPGPDRRQREADKAPLGLFSTAGL